MMNQLEKIIESFPDEEFLEADGFDEAVIGVEESSMRLIYSVKKCIKILAKGMKVTPKDLTDDEIENGMTLQDKAEFLALEYFGFNTKCAHVGEKTPIWCDDDFQ